MLAAAAFEALTTPPHGPVLALLTHTGNWERMNAFRRDVLRSWYQTLRRRSRRSRLTWERFRLRLGNLIPPVQILHRTPTSASTPSIPTSEVGTHHARLQPFPDQADHLVCLRSDAPQTWSRSIGPLPGTA